MPRTENLKRINEKAEEIISISKPKTADEKREFKNGFSNGYVEGAKDIIKIALENFCKFSCIS